MIQRSIQKQLLQLSKSFPAIVILGPRQVGKTTLSKMIAATFKKPVKYLDLERTSDAAILERDAEAFLLAYKDQCVLIDEIQRMPTLFPLLRAMIDANRKPSRFLLTGSASPDLLKGASESLAGRVVYCNLHPIGLHELPSSISLQRHWFRGGFPEALLSKNNLVLEAWLDSFITTYIERDLPFLFDTKFSTQTMRKLWTMLAHLQSGILNAEQLGSSLGVTGTTIKRYLDYLEAAFIITRLQAFHVNIKKRLVKAPKLYINDSGLVHYLLRVHSEKTLLENPLVGASWEGYVVSQILYAKHTRTDAYYYRTQTGVECDLVLAHGHVVKACIEIKLSAAPAISSGFYQSIIDLKCKNNFIICSGTADFKSNNGIRIVDIKTFITKYLPKI
jgi:uncharacterized protein